MIYILYFNISFVLKGIMWRFTPFLSPEYHVYQCMKHHGYCCSIVYGDILSRFQSHMRAKWWIEQYVVMLNDFMVFSRCSSIIVDSAFQVLGQWLPVNSSPPSATYMRQWTGPVLIQKIWTNTDLLPVGPLVTIFGEIWINKTFHS